MLPSLALGVLAFSGVIQVQRAPCTAGRRSHKAAPMAARGAADQGGLVSGIEADVIEASELKVRQGRLAAEGKLAAWASLALLGRETEGPIVEGIIERGRW